MFFRILRLIRTAGRNVVVLWYVCRHRATPKALKLGALFLLLYTFSPVDLVPDWIPFVGWVDDVTLLAIGIPAILRLVPAEVLHEAQMSAASFFSRMRVQ